MHMCSLDESCVSCAEIFTYVCARTCAFAPLLFGLRSASKRARSHGTKPSFDALFRCFQWRVYNTGDGTSCIHRTCAHSPVSQRVLEPYSRSVFVSPLLQGLPPLSTSLPSPFSLSFHPFLLPPHPSFAAFRFVRNTREKWGWEEGTRCSLAESNQ